MGKLRRLVDAYVSGFPIACTIVMLGTFAVAYFNGGTVMVDINHFKEMHLEGMLMAFGAFLLPKSAYRMYYGYKAEIEYEK